MIKLENELSVYYIIMCNGIRNLSIFFLFVFPSANLAYFEQ